MVDISILKLVEEVRRPWNIEYLEAIHITKHAHQNLLNADNGNVTSPLLSLFATKRTYDRDIIDLCDDTPNMSTSEEDELFDCI